MLHPNHDIYKNFTRMTGFVTIGSVDLGLTVKEVKQRLKQLHESGTDKHLVDTKKKRHELGEKLVAGAKCLVGAIVSGRPIGVAASHTAPRCACFVAWCSRQ